MEVSLCTGHYALFGTRTPPPLWHHPIQMFPPEPPAAGDDLFGGPPAGGDDLFGGPPAGGGKM